MLTHDPVVDAAAQHPFWRFSLLGYRQPPVPPACLGLQERRGADVNLALYAVYLGWSGAGRLSGDDLSALAAAIEPWSATVVRALRGVRKALKVRVGPVGPEAAMALRRRVGEIELEAERLEQLALAALLPAPSLPGQEPVADIEANLRGYPALLPEPGDAAADDAAVQALVAAALAIDASLVEEHPVE